MRMKQVVNKKRNSLSLSLVTLLVLVGCSNKPLAAQPSTGWDTLVYFFANAIKLLSLGGSIGVGIVLFTIVIRLVLLPIFNLQIKSGQKMQDIQPEIKALQKKYPDKDIETRTKLAEKIKKLYKEKGVNHYISFVPLLIQMPVMIALYQALTRVPFLKTGSFLWIELSKPDGYLILPILAAVFTYVSSWLTNKAAKEANIAMSLMTYLMPVFVFFMSFKLASGVVLYWSTSYAFQVIQILVFNNPFKIINERLRVEREEKERQSKIRRAKKKALKKR